MSMYIIITRTTTNKINTTKINQNTTQKNPGATASFTMLAHYEYICLSIPKTTSPFPLCIIIHAYATVLLQRFKNTLLYRHTAK